MKQTKSNLVARVEYALSICFPFECRNFPLHVLVLVVCNISLETTESTNKKIGTSSCHTQSAQIIYHRNINNRNILFNKVCIFKFMCGDRDWVLYTHV